MASISSLPTAPSASGPLACPLRPRRPAPDADEVECVGERTREQRDAEGRKRAVDLDSEPAAKVPRAEVGASSSGGDAVPGLDALNGLASLVKDLPAHIQAAAVKWCEDNEAWSVGIIVEAEADDAFVAALSLKPGGMSEIVVRKRLAKAREQVA